MSHFLIFVSDFVQSHDVSVNLPTWFFETFATLKDLELAQEKVGNLQKST